MWIALLGVVAGIELVILAWLAMTVARGTRRREAAEQELADERRRAEDLNQRLEEKTRSAEEYRAKLDKARDEARRAKKKVFDKEQEDRQAPDEDEETRAREAELLEARAELKRTREVAEQAAAEARAQRESAEKLRLELQDARKSLAEKAAQNAPARAPERPRDQDPSAAAGLAEAARSKVAGLEAEIGKLQFKLDAAQKKARNDNQVYRVTRSKLDLAMEKLAYLEARLRAQEPRSTPAAPEVKAAEPEIVTPPADGADKPTAEPEVKAAEPTAEPTE
jgi:chromosome segregation ATPase